MSNSFTRPAYRDLITAFLERGYAIHGFATAKPKASHLILRHDIDFSPIDALALAEIESDLSVGATYFFHSTSPFYNAVDPETKEVCRALLDFGHEVGLHFDAAQFSNKLEELDAQATKECQIIEDAIGVKVNVISFHRPATSLLGLEAPIAGRIHAYQPKFFNHMGYCSDSSGVWRFGDPLSQNAVARQEGLQLLTHPIWWAHDDAGDRERAITRFVERKPSSIKIAVKNVISGYDPATGQIKDGR